jgi:hypothetical protein
VHVFDYAIRNTIVSAIFMYYEFKKIIQYEREEEEEEKEQRQ